MLSLPQRSQAAERVAVISAHSLTIYALQKLIEESTTVQVMPCLTPGSVCREAFVDQPIQLLILDVSGVGPEEQILVRKLRSWLPGAHILVIFCPTEVAEVEPLLELDADSFWAKRSSLKTLLKAVQKSLGAQQAVAVPSIEAGPSAVSESAAAVVLSPREREILELIRLGYSNQQVADRLFLSVSTVKNHMSRIFMKLSANNRIQAVLKATPVSVI